MEPDVLCREGSASQGAIRLAGGALSKWPHRVRLSYAHEAPFCVFAQGRATILLRRSAESKNQPPAVGSHDNLIINSRTLAAVSGQKLGIL
jgi:hypothetical protein